MWIMMEMWICGTTLNSFSGSSRRRNSLGALTPTNEIIAMRSKLILVLFFFLGCTGYSFGVLIDDFAEGPISVERTGDDPATANQVGLDPIRVLGGEREITVGVSGLPNQRLEIGNNFLLGVVTDNLFDATITYGSAIPIGASLISDGSDSFRFDFFDSEIVNGTIDVRSGATSGTAGFRINGTGSITIPFATIEDVDFANVDSVTFGVYRSGAFSIANFRTVPEPTIPFVLILVFGIAQGRRLTT